MTQLRQSAFGNADFGAQRRERFGAITGEIGIEEHALGLDSLNLKRKPDCLDQRNDAFCGARYDFRMARSKPPKLPPAHDWYLAQWLSACAKEQVDLEKELEWNKSKASLMINGKQRYHRDDVNQVADWLNLQPYELLMHPQDAMAIRQLRIDARRVAMPGPPFEVLANDEQPAAKVADKKLAFRGADEPLPGAGPKPRRRRII